MPDQKPWWYEHGFAKRGFTAVPLQSQVQGTRSKNGAVRSWMHEHEEAGCRCSIQAFRGDFYLLTTPFIEPILKERAIRARRALRQPVSTRFSSNSDPGWPAHRVGWGIQITFRANP